MTLGTCEGQRPTWHSQFSLSTTDSGDQMQAVRSAASTLAAEPDCQPETGSLSCGGPVGESPTSTWQFTVRKTGPTSLWISPHPLPCDSILAHDTLGKNCWRLLGRVYVVLKLIMGHRSRLLDTKENAWLPQAALVPI